MRLAVRRAVGTAGATAVAIGAALTLALPASAHTPTITPLCDKTAGTASLTVQMEYYTADSRNSKDPNTVSVSIDGKDVLTNPASPQPFDSAWGPKKWSLDPTVSHTYTVTIYSWEDPKGKDHGPGSTKGVWDGTFNGTIEACVKPSPTPTPTPTPTPSGSSSPTPTPSSSPSTTPSVAAAATSTTPVGGGTLPFTGANVGLPLGIAGALVVIGGGLLFWLRFSAKRRRTS